MRVLRILLLILFIITSIVFGVNQFFLYKNRDDKSPIITFDEEVIHLSVKADDKDMLKGVNAEDDRDGDVTSTLAIASKSNFIEEGVIKVDYIAFDSHNNVGTKSRKVIYDDYHSPRISSKKPLAMRSESSHDFSFFQAEDVLDGDISHKIKILSETSLADSSEYPIKMEVTNNYGDVEKLNIVIDLLSNGEFNLQYPALSEYIIYVPVGTDPHLESYLIGIRQGDKVMDFEETDYSAENIELSTDANYNIPGQYTAVFTLYFSNKDYSETKMVVIVTEDF